MTQDIPNNRSDVRTLRIFTPVGPLSVRRLLLNYMALIGLYDVARYSSKKIMIITIVIIILNE